MANLKNAPAVFFSFSLFTAPAAFAESTFEAREYYSISGDTIYLEVEIWEIRKVIIPSPHYRFLNKEEYFPRYIRTERYKKKCGRWEEPRIRDNGKAYCSFRVLNLFSRGKQLKK